MSFTEYFKRMLEATASNSKDPRTKVGSLLVNDNSIILTGYNGFPRKVGDRVSRWTSDEKYQFVVHAEANLLYLAARRGIATDHCDVYITHHPCIDCVKGMIQAGIDKCYYIKENELIGKHYKEELIYTKEMIEDVGVDAFCIIPI